MNTNHLIVTTRLFDASREKMFRAWSDPAHLVKWWGPAGFTNTFHSFNFRPEGRWEITMHGPDGNDYRNTWVFREIIPNEKIVVDHVEPFHSFTVTNTFNEEAGKTRQTFEMLFVSAEECQRVRDSVTKANEDNFDRLEQELLTM